MVCRAPGTLTTLIQYAKYIYNILVGVTNINEWSVVCICGYPHDGHSLSYTQRCPPRYVLTLVHSSHDVPCIVLNLKIDTRVTRYRTHGASNKKLKNETA